jgi:hypothetical protein
MVENIRFMFRVPICAVAGIILAAACDVASGQISVQEGRWVVSQGGKIASNCIEYLKTEYGDSKGESAFEDAELLRIVTTASSAWEFYSRDRGILIAIDAGPDVPAVIRNSGASKIARAAEAVIRQEREMAIADRVTVIFIDPGLREIGMRLSQPRSVPLSPIQGGTHVGWEYGSRPVGIGSLTSPSAVITAHEACDCR